jgi:hypothetical protein
MGRSANKRWDRNALAIGLVGRAAVMFGRSGNAVHSYQLVVVFHGVAGNCHNPIGSHKVISVVYLGLPKCRTEA